MLLLRSLSVYWLGMGLRFSRTLPLIPLVGRRWAGMMSLTSPSPGLCLQDEVAHTVTESRVLQNTRHPFLTVSGPPLRPVCRARPPGQPCAQSSERGPTLPQGGTDLVLASVLGFPDGLNRDPRGGGFFIDSGFLSAPQLPDEITLQDSPRRAWLLSLSVSCLAQLVEVETLFFCFCFKL